MISLIPSGIIIESIRGSALILVKILLASFSMLALIFTYCSGYIVNEFLNRFSRKKRV